MLPLYAERSEGGEGGCARNRYGYTAARRVDSAEAGGRGSRRRSPALTTERRLARSQRTVRGVGGDAAEKKPVQPPRLSSTGVVVRRQHRQRRSSFGGAAQAARKVTGTAPAIPTRAASVCRSAAAAAE
ncbi:hypothetical protein HPB50_025365 [Hyalomma asiaticum]|uniref:Uncharacterized protein n=1 Tax=Hyalomma asiaticum TaxID=266040 RepID=A0ACB7T1M0_HYAAI|nr:hypothetical protein HPB50_025365 [Hyalomma asiaticum]